MISNLIITLIIAYLLGSIPFSFLLGKIYKKVDLREHGSGNVGATNALRVLGWKTGVLAMLLDMFKGVAAIYIASSLLPEQVLLLISAGFMVILGHIFTIFLHFKGGKGVATSAGVFAALLPIPFLFALLSFIITTALSRYVSLGSIVAALVLIITQAFFTFRNGVQSPWYLVLTLIVTFFIIMKHRANIKRLLNGTENRITFRNGK
jgi:glycerol-3-phosphate acyltransferase PlsY